MSKTNEYLSRGIFIALLNLKTTAQLSKKCKCILGLIRKADMLLRALRSTCFIPILETSTQKLAGRVFRGHNSWLNQRTSLDHKTRITILWLCKRMHRGDGRCSGPPVPLKFMLFPPWTSVLLGLWNSKQLYLFYTLDPGFIACKNTTCTRL